jgi:uncharacterized membrane protein YjdF
MKKINITLYFIIVVLAFLTIFSELNSGTVSVLKYASIILTAGVPFIVNKLWKNKLNDGFILVWLIFIFSAHYLGVIDHFYSKYPGFDKFTHTISGFLSAYFALWILKSNKANNMSLNIIFIIAFSWMCAGLWETFEFTCDHLFHGDAQMVVATGVTDTMLDMIVAFLGSICFTIGYYFKNKCK